MRHPNRSPDMTLRVLHIFLVAALIGASLGSIGLWVHSYMNCLPRSYAPEKMEMILGLRKYARSECGMLQPEEMSRILFGLWEHLKLGDRVALRVDTCTGRFWLRLSVGIQAGAPVQASKVLWRGLGYERWKWTTSSRTEYEVSEIAAPIGLLAIAFIAYPLFAFARGPLRRYRRRRRNQCIKCGYDLTGNVSGVCPECGTRVLKSGGVEEDTHNPT